MTCLLINTSIVVLWLILGSGSGSGSAAAVVVINGTVRVEGAAAIGKTSRNFICATLDWWPPTKCDYGTCSWASSSLLNLDLTNNILLNAVKAFSPLKIRLGGTLQDKVRYQTTTSQPCPPFFLNSSELFGFTHGCLPIARWDALNRFFIAAGAKIIFGLNALDGRTIGADGTCTGPWNSSNSEFLIRHTINKSYPVFAWELGNELSGRGIGARIAADQYASDVTMLKKIVDDAYKGFQHKPLVVAPGGFFDAVWFQKFIAQTPASLQVVSHHIYNLGPGVDTHLIDKILDPSYLDGGAQPFRDLQNILKSDPSSSAVAWVGEAGGAYNSGHNLVTNAFVFSFWYLDQLGMSASYNTKTYCRQTLIGGNYGLLNTTNFVPNPDYYSALLWHRLMGRHVLSTSFVGTKSIRAYAHCSNNSEGITLLLMNLDNTTAVQVSLSVENAIPKKTVTIQKRQGNLNDVMKRQEYHLTAKDGDLHSQTMLLNGEIISVNSSGTIPSLEPTEVDTSEPIHVAPLSIVFAQVPSVSVPACL